MANNVFVQDRRLVILRVLSESAGYTASDSNLDDSLDSWGHTVSRDVVIGEMYWLAEQQLITLREMGSTQIATITQRGLDVASGQAIHPGVKRPRP
ncbi:hypothetical protein [Vibrio scophthalmi]|uniref:Uncharacterized protein n=1 Tax=Vibrio scophthalmi TaxID=45658 RepID=A0A1E3WMF6_9VIBR|nr:hypothetical protein [Vibrio scophthalmi]ODS10938.1 uncharacterized protein VSF3289_01199 [Vibrio scophthalmi]